MYSLGTLFDPLRLYPQNRRGRRTSIRFSCCLSLSTLGRMKTRNDRTMTDFAHRTAPQTHFSTSTQLLALINVARTGKWINPRFSATPLGSGLAVIVGAKRFPHITDDLFKDVFVGLPEHEVEDLAMSQVTEEERQIALNLTFIRLLQFLSYEGSRLLEGLHAMERQRGNREMRTRVFNEVSRGDDEEATLGVDTVNKLIQLNFDGGLSYMFTHLTIDAHLIPPSDRVNMVYWALRESPMFAWTVRKCAELYNTRKRVLVVARKGEGQPRNTGQSLRVPRPRPPLRLWVLRGSGYVSGGGVGQGYV
ncbi:hypothetical protein GE21DRAFT_8671 [Neurospora crassa]|uniref:Uncharacterized protein n=1 Tax=Neurospora crassa (strain ATCC 24698 / 74-OR23-1A / CBS 708.71 / DSM 1257 / FGSC 987) TaxID=367110 RepID=Q7S657_NEUCR|nr:hypothetical protein NCU04703 [Neurospora crassa OR74A]EAA30998.3 hypothetical protein NCU04703 [Neurospora crassa OR74A]KHE83275.1 hypothetical protein GE21DRAFT_8671 [Neurospora crassa]|eukprot:XP_960234.3 hypothetical protein NCU04703 [Neurospora crassa OR74A]